MRAEGARLKPAGRLRRFLGLVLLAALPLSAAAESPSDTAILDAFGKIAFGDELMADPDPRLQKWVQPIRWRTYEYVPLTDDERAFLDRLVGRLARLTGLDIAPAPSWPEANLVILFVSEDRYPAMIERYLAPNRRHLLARLAATSCMGLPRHHKLTFAIE